MSQIRIAALNIFPLKSGRGIPVERAALTVAGLEGDRIAMLAAPSGMGITQRDVPALARLTAEIRGDGLSLSFDGGSAISARPGETRQTVEIWGSRVDAALAEESVNATLSSWLGTPLVLAFFDAEAARDTGDGWNAGSTPITFSDGYQILVTTTASLEALKADSLAHGEPGFGMDRFRANIVLEGLEAYEEDAIAALSIHGVRLDFVKPCARCIMTTQDQETGARDVADPMPAMRRTRLSGDRSVPGVLFGWNVVPRGEAILSVGDVVEIAERRETPWPIRKARSA